MKEYHYYISWVYNDEYGSVFHGDISFRSEYIKSRNEILTDKDVKAVAEWIKNKYKYNVIPLILGITELKGGYTQDE